MENYLIRRKYLISSYNYCLWAQIRLDSWQVLPASSFNAIIVLMLIANIGQFIAAIAFIALMAINNIAIYSIYSSYGNFSTYSYYSAYSTYRIYPGFRLISYNS